MDRGRGGKIDKFIQCIKISDFQLTIWDLWWNGNPDDGNIHTDSYIAMTYVMEMNQLVNDCQRQEKLPITS